MTPQSPFTIVAPLAAGREADLRALLESMNQQPGSADPHNAVLPFGDFAALHFARLVLIDDSAMADLAVYGVTPPRLATVLVFMGDCDGAARDVLGQMAQRCASGLRQLFGHCEGFDAGADLLAWMVAHDVPVATFYVCRRGRSVRQVREEHALWRALAARVPRDAATASPRDAQRVRDDLVAFVAAEQRAGRLPLTPPAATPLRWQVANLANLIGVALLGLVALPFLVVLAPLLIVMLRRRERSDPEVCPPLDPDALLALQRLEDQVPTNQFTAVGPVKPGLFRRWLLTALLLAADYACRHVFHRGHLTRIQTIHFARWVFLDGKSRVLFVSNYDGSHEAYMDDFINKVGWGLNILFSNGVGWPRTDWLVKRGSRRELLFKRYQRRHQVPTQVWYMAYAGLTLADLERAQRIREGLERTPSSNAQALAWLRLL